MASYTFYSDTGDNILGTANSTWASAQSGPVFTFASSNSWDCGVSWVSGNGTYQIQQAFFRFDTSALADNAEIIDATLSIYTDNIVGSPGTYQARGYDYGASLTTADWRDVSAWNALTLLASCTQSALASGGYSAFTNNGVNLADWVSKTGVTGVVVAASNWTGIAPAVQNSVDIYWADNAGTSKDPKLEVTTFEPPSFSPTVSWIA